jgi:hypothetical protein
MQLLGSKNDRDIYYLNLQGGSPDWGKTLPAKPWVAAVYSDRGSIDFIDEVLKISLKARAQYICGMGEQNSIIDDIGDEIQVMENLDNEDYDGVITTFHSSLAEGIWFAIWAANSDVKMNSVVFINLEGENEGKKIKSIISKVLKGWIPPDEEETG